MELEKTMGYPIRGMAYPNGSSNEKVCRIANSLGMEYGRVAADKYAAVYAAQKGAKEAEGPILLGDETGLACLKIICSGFRPATTTIIW